MLCIAVVGACVGSVALLRGKSPALVTTYDYYTCQLSDLLLLGTNETELMDRARLRLDVANYLMLAVF